MSPHDPGDQLGIAAPPPPNASQNPRSTAGGLTFRLRILNLQRRLGALRDAWNKRGTGMVRLVIATIALLVTACYSGPAPSHFVAVADELMIPAQWHLAKSIVRGPNEQERCEPFEAIDCPGAIRSYLVNEPADAAYLQAKQLVTSAGFAVTREFTPGCTGSRPACGFEATRGSDQLLVTVYHSAGDVGLSAEPSVAAVVITAQRKA